LTVARFIASSTNINCSWQGQVCMLWAFNLPI
jgi:hypothetical protein